MFFVFLPLHITNSQYMRLIPFISTFTCFLILSSLSVKPQNEYIDIKLETSGTFTAGDYAPFWITNNNYGIGSEYRNKGYLRAGIYGGKQFSSNELKLSVAADMLVSNNMQSDFYFHQLYADLKYKILEMSVGAKERNSLFKNKGLSTGGLTLSNNARPIPQVEISIPEFVEIPFTGSYVHFLTGGSYGRFLDNGYKKRYAGDGKYAEDVLYHRKYFFLKIEKNTPWNVILGIEMDTQWGGKFYDYENGHYASSPAKIKDFFKVLVLMSGGGDSNNTDQVNIVGNVYGSYHITGNYKWKNFSVKAYHEHFFEDHSGMIFKNIPDGIYGLEFTISKKSPVTSILFEYIHTKNQSGPFLFDESPEIPIQVSGGDNYYNHVEYVSLTNYGMVTGNPLLTSPIYNNKRTLYSLNTRISAFHGGISGYINDHLKYRLLATYSRSWGTPFIPSLTIRNQFSGLVEMNYTPPNLEGWAFGGALGYDDSANMVGDNTGINLKVSKLFHIR